MARNIISSLIFVVIAVISISSCYSLDPRVKTDVKDLTPMEKLLIRLFHPEVPLAELEKLAGTNKRSVLEDYGGIQLWNLDLPTFLLQLVKFGNDIPFPGWHLEYGFYYCYLGICIGFLNIYDHKNPTLTNATQTQLTSSLNGTVLQLNFSVPDARIQTPEFTLHEHDLVTEDQVFWRGLTVYLGNYTVGFTGNFTVGQNGLQVSQVHIDFTLDDLRIQKHNATHVLPDGTAEEWGPVETQVAGDIVEIWVLIKEEVEATIEEWLNCFLTNGRSGAEACEGYLSSSVQHQTFAQILHTFGLASLNNQRS